MCSVVVWLMLRVLLLRLPQFFYYERFPLHAAKLGKIGNKITVTLFYAASNMGFCNVEMCIHFLGPNLWRCCGLVPKIALLATVCHCTKNRMICIIRSAFERNTGFEPAALSLGS